jgi:AcrR family transcriptional regulator
MNPTPDFDRLPLRQRKYARTKLGLLDATLTALAARSLEDVTVGELCEAVSISEASFFNYFPRKADLLVYYVQLWSLEMAWHSQAQSSGPGGLTGIEEIFARTGRRIAEHPGVMVEIIGEQVRMTDGPDFPEVTVAERLLAFPDLSGIETETAVGVEELLPPLLYRAIETGELPRDTDRAAVLTALSAIFFGVPVVHRRTGAGEVEAAYRRQLLWLWAGLGARG